MKNIFLYSSNPYSRAAKELSKGLGIKRLKHHGSRFKATSKTILINWGCTARALDFPGKIINNPSRVMTMSNKLFFFRKYNRQFRHPDWTIDKKEAKGWIDNGYKVVCRTLLSSSAGKGIVIKNDLDIPDAPLYTKYIPKESEYRVHYLGGKEIFIQRKVLRSDYSGSPKWEIRSHNNGFKFVHGPDLGVIPEDVWIQSSKAYEVSGLDFGAVDVIWNNKKKEAYVLEINTAPGLEGTTITRYVEGFRALLHL